MSYSKRQLYALGEPLGDCVTHAKPGGGRVYGGGSSSSSSQASNSYDNRVTAQDAVALSASNNNQINVLDGGAIQSALDSININNALFYEGADALLEMGKEIFNAGQSNISQLQKHVADAYTTAHAEKAGTIDNRTVIILGVALVAGVALIKKG